MIIPYPSLMFLGDVDEIHAKTALGVRYWRPHYCVGQLRLPGCEANLGIPDMTPAVAAEAGARSMLIGVANVGGSISPGWIEFMLEALECGLDLASGLHQRLASIDAIRITAESCRRKLFDVRHPMREQYKIANGERRSGKRLLTVGTDCAVGKMYTALALESEMQRRGLKADFRATGQTGIFIAGGGVAVDAVVSDFVAGAAELLSPDSDPDHWDLIEGQGSLSHPAFASVTLGLVHGSQPDALVVCHDASRVGLVGAPAYKAPSLEDCIALNLGAARLTNPSVRIAGISINTSKLPAAQAMDYLESTSRRIGLPCCDPVRTGVGPIVDGLLTW